MVVKTCYRCGKTSSLASFTYGGEYCRECKRWFCLFCVTKHIKQTGQNGCLNCGKPYTSFTEGS